jgi:hypothetical protein
MKIGRNDPCPCGSGKKYKKCCGAKGTTQFELPEDLRTGTPLDEYRILLRGVAMYYDMLIQHDDDRKELSRAEKDFERDFRPGSMTGVPDSLFLPWLYFDLRFGKTGKTVCERFLESSWMKDLNEAGIQRIREMSGSYSTFYEVLDVSPDLILFGELGTGAKWRIHRLGGPDEEETRTGDIWYVRFVGSRDDAYVFSLPYIYDPDVRDGFEKAVAKQTDNLAKAPGRLIVAENLFAEGCKATIPLWAEYFMYCDAQAESKVLGPVIQSYGGPAICNTDGEPLKFCKIFFKTQASEGLKDKLSSLRGFDYDEQNKTWIWFRKGNKQMSTLPSTTLGTISLKKGRLVAEANSEERALKLMAKLKKELKDFVTFEKMEAKDLSDMPPPTEKQRKKFEKEQEEMNANPEIRELLSKQAESYYHNDWMKHEIPMFGNRTPPEAVRTREGREKVEVFLDDLEASQNARPTDPFRVDVDGLRKCLSLIPENAE